MTGGIPDRWLDYKPTGKQIGSTPFVAHKCPLNKNLLRSLPREAQFDVDDLKNLLPNVKLVIDLTDTDRYYDGKCLQKLGISYEKIRVPGHYIPKIDLIKRFFRIVDDFIQKNKISDSTANLIGVHCTHGVNRTGFFICSYLISKLGFNYQEAIDAFGLARGHNIERENYLNTLRRYEKRPLKFYFSRDSFESQRAVEKYERKTNGPQYRNNRPEYSSNIITRRQPSYTAVNDQNYYGKSHQRLHRQDTRSAIKPEFSMNYLPFVNGTQSRAYNSNYSPCFYEPPSEPQFVPMIPPYLNSRTINPVPCEGSPNSYPWEGKKVYRNFSC